MSSSTRLQHVTFAVCAASALLGGSAAAVAAQPALIASQQVSATCENTFGGDNWAQGFGGGLEQGALRRLVVTNASGDNFLELGDPISGARFHTTRLEPGLISWYEGTRPIRPGGLETWFLPTCTPGASFGVEWYQRPEAPAVFAGQGTAATGASVIGVRAPAQISYAVDLALSQGSVRVNGRTVVSSQSVVLGEQPAGDVSVTVAPASAAPAVWQATIRALPVELGTPRASAVAIRPGSITKVSYTLSGDSRVGAQVLSGDGALVRDLAGSSPVAKGSRSVIWDGRLLDGRRVPDGRYLVRLTSSDYSGAVEVKDVAVVVDGRAPTAQLLSRAVGPRQTIRFRLRDPHAKVASAKAKLAGRPVRSRVTLAGVLVLSPPSAGWGASGPRIGRLTVKDRAGNTLARRFAVTIRR